MERNDDVTVEPASVAGTDVDVEVDDRTDVPSGNDTWRLWPPSPKVQILLIAGAFGLFNIALIALWAIIMLYRF
jgi:hypothetical protein